VKDPIPIPDDDDDDVAGFWLLHADDEELLFIAEDQSMVEADMLVFAAEFCAAGRNGMAEEEGAEG